MPRVPNGVPGPNSCTRRTGNFGDAASRHRPASPIHLFAAAAVEVATPRGDLTALDDAAARPRSASTALRDRRMGGAQLSRRSATCGSRTAAEPAPAHGRRFRGPRSQFSGPTATRWCSRASARASSSCGGSQCATADPHSSRSAHCNPAVPSCGPTATRSRTSRARASTRRPRPSSRHSTCGGKTTAPSPRTSSTRPGSPGPTTAGR